MVFKTYHAALYTSDGCVLDFFFYYLRVPHLSDIRALTVYFYFTWTPAVMCDLRMATISLAKPHSEGVIIR